MRPTSKSVHLSPLLVLLVAEMTTAVCSSPYTNRGQVRYWELQRMNASCYPLDTCREARPPGDDLKTSNCLCDKTCALFDACCLDSPYRFYRPPTKVKHNCFPIFGDPSHRHVFMVDQCSPGWTGDAYVSTRCTGGAEEHSDPLLLLPVTNAKTGVTYKNYFCAACNDEANLRHGVFWLVTITSNLHNITRSALSDLRYDSYLGAWVMSGEADEELDYVTIRLVVPDRAGEQVKTCRRDVTSGCAEGWPDDVTRRKCESYTAIVAVPDPQVGRKRFRNIHCAICHGNTDVDGVLCSQIDAVGFGGAAPGKRPLSFALLLDVNRSDGDVVGEVQRCPGDEIYDPFFKTCRVRKCGLPGFVIKDNGCVKAS